MLKTQILFWHIPTKLKNYWHLLNPPFMGKYNYSRNISFTIFYGNYVYYFHNQLTIKPMSITHGKSCRVKPSRSKLINKAQLGLVGPHTNPSKLENTWTTQLNFSKNGTAGAPSHQAITCLIRSENGHVSTRGWIFSLQAEVSSFLKWHKVKDDVTESWESWKSFCQLLLLSSSAHIVKKPKLPWPDQWSSWNNTKSAHFHNKNMYFQVHEPSTWTLNGET